MSIGNDIKNDIGILEERIEDVTIKPQFNIRSGTRSLPYTSVNGITETDSNGCRSLGKIFHYFWLVAKKTGINNF